MRQKLSTLVFFIILVLPILNAQEIKQHRFQGGYRYTKGKEVLKLKKLANAVAADKEAYNLATQAKSMSDLGLIISAIGGAFIGAPIGKALANGEPKWLSAGIGGGLVLAGFQFYRISGDKAKSAIDIHNNNLSFQPTNKPKIHLTVTTSELGFLIEF